MRTLDTIVRTAEAVEPAYGAPVLLLIAVAAVAVLLVLDHRPGRRCMRSWRSSSSASSRRSHQDPVPRGRADDARRVPAGTLANVALPVGLGA